MQNEIVNYNEKCDILFDNIYIPTMIRNNDIINNTEFAKDGIIYRPAGGNSCMESFLWHKSKAKILLLLKDCNANDGYTDARILKEVNNSFGKNIGAWVYSIHRIINDGVKPDISKAYETTNNEKGFQEFPFAILNIKKSIGGNSVSNVKIKKHAINYSNLIKEQLNILKPNIILCCGGSGDYHIFNLLQKYIIEDFQANYKLDVNSENILYSKEKELLIVKTYHPSARVKKEVIYSIVGKIYDLCLQQRGLL